MIFPTLNINIERWKFNKEFGIYVSTLGHFKNRYKKDLHPMIDYGGYVKIKTDLGFKNAHRIVMLTWKPTLEAENLTVDHLDHNKRNNSLKNLEWVSEEENLKRAKEDYLEEKIARKKTLEKEEEKKIRIIVNDKDIFSLDEAVDFFHNKLLTKWINQGKEITEIDKKCSRNCIKKDLKNFKLTKYMKCKIVVRKENDND